MVLTSKLKIPGGERGVGFRILRFGLGFGVGMGIHSVYWWWIVGCFFPRGSARRGRSRCAEEMVKFGLWSGRRGRRG